MTKAELQKGMATADGDCALGNRSVSALPLGARKLAGLVALSNDLGHDRSQRLFVKPLQAAPQPSSVERPPKSPRRPAPNISSSTATSSPEACDEGHDAEWRGRGASSEVPPAPISLVSEIMLMDVDQERRPAAHLGTRPSLTLHRGSRGATAEGEVVPGG